MRGLAIALVLVWHGFSNLYQAAPSTLPAYLARATALTWSGVDLFFVLSGYLIVGILLDNRDCRNYFSVFYARRFCRIVPAYFLFLLAYQAVRAIVPPAHAWWTFDHLPMWSYFAFVQNLIMGAHDALGGMPLAPTWSLAVEEQFYLVVPLAIRLLPPRVAVAVFVGLVLGSPVYRALASGVGSLVYPFARCDSLLLGALLAHVVRHRGAMNYLIERPWLLRSALAVLLAGVLPILKYVPYTGHWLNHLWLSALYGAVLLWAQLRSSEGGTSMFRWRVLVWLGTRSYSIYLYHAGVIGLAFIVAQGRHPVIDDGASALVAAGAIAVTLVLSELSYRLVERPAMDLGHRLKYAR